MQQSLVRLEAELARKEQELIQGRALLRQKKQAQAELQSEADSEKLDSALSIGTKLLKECNEGTSVFLLFKKPYGTHSELENCRLKRPNVRFCHSFHQDFQHTFDSGFLRLL